MKDFSIIEVLDQQDPKHKHTYKEFKNLNKHSSIQEVYDIIVEMLEQHNQEGPLSSSEQYILSGYLLKYIDCSLTDSKLRRSLFNLNDKIS